ncbi:Gfo/Idh/MocA family oxidoreductase [Sphingobacterium sp. lm-10]|uniref:Gfo/Idh/MocA family protein n=1 Tax=Sphingobacterium sp. lm-10 TaxID=2944904 RepID=UPI0020222AC9|nr:Gfo/Idh/MocA family oxidoreductase [Sphingobacterium sp. lm-10]MCL7988235.1 Gfo/Idh/MocA family oxidoreductase [Sphingobacterium sp. lm-10]
MDNSRRSFLRQASLLSGLALSLPNLASATDFAPAANMSGYRAPKIDRVKIAIVGLGNRGEGAVSRFTYIEGVEIVALCDRHTDRVNKQQQKVVAAGLPEPKHYAGDDGWKRMLDEEDLDLLYICTPWQLHAPMSIAAMEAGTHVACEVPIGLTMDELWNVVRVSERTRKHCMMLENCCYDFFELITLNMAQKGLFGELIHAEGAYIHDLLDLNFSKTYYDDFWRLRENIRLHGNLYPTHGIGPIAQCMNINRGDQISTLVNIQSADFHMAQKAKELAQKDQVFQPFVGKAYRGNMNTTVMKTSKGKTMMVQHDVTSPRPYSRIHLLSGTTGFAQKYPSKGMSFTNHKNGHAWLPEGELSALETQYTPDLVKLIGERAKAVGGHGGMDFIMDWRLIDCLRNGLPLDQDVYDAASWSAIVPLSIQSSKQNGRQLNFPDFTKGNWKTNTPVNLSLEGGGNTGVRAIKKPGEGQLQV